MADQPQPAPQPTPQQPAGSPVDDFARQILVDCEAFEAKIQAGIAKTFQIAQDNVTKSQEINDQLKQELSAPASPSSALG